jgi:hypothetical protein
VPRNANLLRTPIRCPSDGEKLIREEDGGSGKDFSSEHYAADGEEEKAAVAAAVAAVVAELKCLVEAIDYDCHYVEATE